MISEKLVRLWPYQSDRLLLPLRIQLRIKHLSAYPFQIGRASKYISQIFASKADKTIKYLK